ncbi:MAG: SDR family oxidoreductase [Saprospiraceae bacterium]
MNSPITSKPVLLTGITGYIGSRLAVDLLNRGYAVRGTMRNAAKRDKILPAIKALAPTDKLEIVSADLLEADSWNAAVAGCDYVFHVASPYVSYEPKDPNELIKPAVDGTLNVLKAATTAGVKRVVLTSSLAAVGYGLDATPSTPMTEERWTKVDHPDVGSYTKSKTLAERAAWDYVKATNGAPELSVINPSGVLGPVLSSASLSATNDFVVQFLQGKIPAMPKIAFDFVDVRDVSELHIHALEDPKAAGERYLAVSGMLSMKELSGILGEGFPDYKSKLPTRELPNWLVKTMGMFDKNTKVMVGELGKRRLASNQKARDQFGWNPRTPKEAALATGVDVIAFEMV